jgi:hypothetical protein
VSSGTRRPTELKFTLDAESMKQAGRFDLVVINPAPTDTFFTRGMWGNGTSNLAHIVVITAIDWFDNRSFFDRPPALCYITSALTTKEKRLYRNR